jgi:hypothetical protein
MSTLARADVPSVISMELNKEGDSAELQVRHNSPSTSHFVDVIEVDLDGKVKSIELGPQSSTTFTEIIEITGKVAKMRVRAHCTTHGWSEWNVFNVDQDSEATRFIPGFPVISILAGILTASLLVYSISRK